METVLEANARVADTRRAYMTLGGDHAEFTRVIDAYVAADGLRLPFFATHPAMPIRHYQMAAPSTASRDDVIELALAGMDDGSRERYRRILEAYAEANRQLETFALVRQELPAYYWRLFATDTARLRTCLRSGVVMSSDLDLSAASTARHDTGDAEAA